MRPGRKGVFLTGKKERIGEHDVLSLALTVESAVGQWFERSDVPTIGRTHRLENAVFRKVGSDIYQHTECGRRNIVRTVLTMRILNNVASPENRAAKLLWNLIFIDWTRRLISKRLNSGDFTSHIFASLRASPAIV